MAGQSRTDAGAWLSSISSAQRNLQHHRLAGPSLPLMRAARREDCRGASDCSRQWSMAVWHVTHTANQTTSNKWVVRCRRTAFRVNIGWTLFRNIARYREVVGVRGPAACRPVSYRLQSSNQITLSYKLRRMSQANQRRVVSMYTRLHYTLRPQCITSNSSVSVLDYVFFLNSLADLGQKRVPDGWHAGTKGFHWQRYTVSSNDRKLREGDSEKSQMTLSADEACVLYGDSTLKKILLSLHKCQHPVATQEIIRMGLFRMVTAKSRHTWGSQRNL